MSRTKREIFSERLKAARLVRGLSQGDLAELSGLKPAAVSHFETGQRTPSLNNLIRLADALDVSADYLLGRIKQPQAQGTSFDMLLAAARDLKRADLNTIVKFSEMLSQQNKKK